MKMAPSVVKAFTKSMSAYRTTQYASEASLQSFAPYILKRKPLETIKEFREVNLSKNK